MIPFGLPCRYTVFMGPSNPCLSYAGAWYSHPALAVYLVLIVTFGAACRTQTAEPAVSEGRRIYKEQCVACHGPHGRGDGYVLFTPPVADLTSAEVQRKSDAELFRSIHQGRPNTMMGSWRLALSDQELWAVIQYMRHLGDNHGTAP